MRTYSTRYRSGLGARRARARAGEGVECTSEKIELNKPTLPSLSQHAFYRTSSCLPGQEEWQVAAVVSTIKSCRLSANIID